MAGARKGSGLPGLGLERIVGEGSAVVDETGEIDRGDKALYSPASAISLKISPSNSTRSVPA